MADWHRVDIQKETNFPGLFCDIVHQYDGQICDEASPALYLLSEAVRRHVAVALCGDGGDEFFAGYPTYKASFAAALAGRAAPKVFWGFAGQAAYKLSATSETRLPASDVASRFALGLSDGHAGAHVQWRRYLPQFMQKALYGEALTPFLDNDPYEEYKSYLRESEGDLIDRCMIADQRFHLPGSLLLKSDLMSMAHSLELRVPFLDRRVMDFAGRCDWRLALGLRGPMKKVLRSAARSLGAPQAVLQGKKKGFNAPLAALLRRELAPLAKLIFDTSPDVLAPYLKADAVRQLWKSHAAGEANHAYALWPMLNLGVWLSARSALPFERRSRRMLD